MICSKNTKECDSYGDKHIRGCDRYEDRGYRKCDSWGRWIRWACTSWFWVANNVCVAPFKVTKKVCTSWVEVKYRACEAYNSFANFLCLNTHSINLRYSASNQPFTPRSLLDTVRLSAGVYHEADGIRRALGSDINIRQEHLTIIDDRGTDTEGAVCYFKGNIYIAFRGSEFFSLSELSLQDISTNISVLPSSYFEEKGAAKVFCGSKLHGGFLDAYLSVKEDVTNAVLALLNNHKVSNIYVTGHSLGGAIATICALDIQRSLTAKNVIMHSYGTPAVGNKFFASIYNKEMRNSWRIIVEADPIVSILDKLYNHVKGAYTLRRRSSSEQSVSMENHNIDRYVNMVRDMNNHPENFSNNSPEYGYLEVSLPVSNTGRAESTTNMIGNRATQEIHMPNCKYVKYIANKNKFIKEKNVSRNRCNLVVIITTIKIVRYEKIRQFTI